MVRFLICVMSVIKRCFDLTQTPLTTTKWQRRDFSYSSYKLHVGTSWPEGDEILLVGKRDHASTVFFRHRKQILEDVGHLRERVWSGQSLGGIPSVTWGTHPLPQLGGEVVKDEVGERLWHGSDVWDVMSHHHIVKCKISRGSKR